MQTGVLVAAMAAFSGLLMKILAWVRDERKDSQEFLANMLEQSRAGHERNAESFRKTLEDHSRIEGEAHASHSSEHRALLEAQTHVMDALRKFAEGGSA